MFSATDKEKQCISLSKKVRLSYLKSKLTTDKFDLLILERIIGAVFKIFSVFVELPLSPKDKSLHALWMLHGPGTEYDDEVRLDVLQQWMLILYPDLNIDIETMKKGNSVIHTTHADVIDFIVRDSDLPDYDLFLFIILNNSVGS